MTEIILILLASALLAWPLGHYLARVLAGGASPLDRVFAPIEGACYRLLGIEAKTGMTAGGYARAFLISNLCLGLIVYAILMLQHRLPLNPDQVPALSWDTALHTMVSFLTNTNQQHYSGQAQLSYLSQLAGLTTLQVLTPMMGLAIAAAMLRGLFGGRGARDADGAVDVGNYYVDVTRLSLRVFLPMALVLALALTATGVPATWSGAARATPIDASAGMSEQAIARGPVAPMVATKQLGTNGGGWYGPNSAVPLENPTPVSNALETLAIVLWPIAIGFMVGPFTGRRRLSALVLGVMGALSLAMIVGAVVAENQANAAFAGLAAPGANLEGKEVRFGAEASALWATLTTQTSNGSVNAMHDSMQPATVLIALCGMLMNATWGGVGCGLVNFFVFVLLTVFLAGLLIGRSPEIFGRKLEVREVRLLSLLVVLQPLAILGASALTMAVPGVAGTSNPGAHGFAQVFYEYTSAYANNGSGLEGLGDGTVWWNVSTVLVLLLGRFLTLLLPLFVAASLGAKRAAPESPASLRIESVTFAITMAAVVILLAVLSYLPALVLGPVAEGLSLPR